MTRRTPRFSLWLLAGGLLALQVTSALFLWSAATESDVAMVASVVCILGTIVLLVVLMKQMDTHSREIAAELERSASGNVRSRLEALRSDFAANVSHELRTPITNIKGYVETLMEVGVSDREQTAKFLDVIHRNSERLGLIIEDLLALARLEQPNAKGGLQRDVTPLTPIVESVLSHVEEERFAKDIEIDVNLARDLAANVNGQLIEQALGNLVSNAIKYSPPETRVTIRATLNRRGEVELIVSDQGPGIASEHLPRLFERFYRVDRARSREMGGTGLGLAIVKHIAQVHGGRVDVESEVGRGSTFRIILPPSLP